ncbi:hypothetical protein [Euzebya pacifica]|uniref:hypothetical protein n=1 Tax=Euzebya pacifica TaxID=1608957 RepID=UPI0030FB855C
MRSRSAQPPRATAGAAASGEDGFVTAEWMVGMALLVVPTLLVVAVLPSWASRHEAAAVAAREGARAAATAVDVATARTAAEQAVVAVLDGRGIPPDEASVTVHLPPGTSLPRDGEVRVRVVLPTSPVTLPGGGTVEGPSVTGDHIRVLDPHRGR